MRKNVLRSITFLLLGLSTNSQSQTMACETKVLQDPAGNNVAAYPVVYIDLLSEQQPNIDQLLYCDETTYVVIRTPNQHCTLNEDSERYQNCVFDFQVVEEDEEGLIFETYLEMEIQDHGRWAQKIQACPRSNYLVATGFFRFQYLGGSTSAMAYQARSVEFVADRAEATWQIANETCFDFNEN